MVGVRGDCAEGGGICLRVSQGFLRAGKKVTDDVYPKGTREQEICVWAVGFCFEIN